MNEQFYKALTSKHSDYEKECQYWRRLEKLTKGGQAVDTKTKADLLINPINREKPVIEARAKVATYEPIMGTILLKMVSHLLRDEAVYSGGEDEFWAEFFDAGAIDPRSATGRCSFHQFLRQATYQALVSGMAIAQIDVPQVPEAKNRAEQMAMGRDKPYLILRKRSDLWDWARDEKGWQFAKLHSYYEKKQSWSQPPDRYHKFLIYERTENGTVLASSYQVRLNNDDGNRDFSKGMLDQYSPSEVNVTPKFENQDIFHIYDGGDRLFGFPLICLTFDGAMWLADQLEQLQVGQFNSGAAGDWALASTNYAMPVITLSDATAGQQFNDNPLRYSKLGDGYWLELMPGAKLSWFERGTAGIDIAFTREETYRKRMFDYIHQVSSIVAAGYIKQSGESKKEDRRALDILLEVYGQKIREFAKQILDVAAIAHGQKVDWTIQGFSDYDSETLEESLAEYLAIDQAGIDSKTLKNEAQKVIATRYATEYGLPDEKINEIVDELDANPFHLTADELEVVLKTVASIANGVPPELALGLLRESNYLTDEMFDKAIAYFEEMGLTNEVEESEPQGTTETTEADTTDNGNGSESGDD